MIMIIGLLSAHAGPLPSLIISSSCCVKFLTIFNDKGQENVPYDRRSRVSQ